MKRTLESGDSRSATQAAGRRRFWLWVDGVGGFLVCEENDCTLGQPVSGQGVDVPILGDISGRHAVIHRDGDAYLFEPLRTSAVDGRRRSAPCVLAARATIQLGESVRLGFRRPHAYSASACLDLESPHQTQPVSDGVVLAADSVVLGPGPTAHVRCDSWNREVVLYRRDDTWSCRTAGDVEIDGRFASGGGAISRRSRVVGSDFCFTLEEAG